MQNKERRDGFRDQSRHRHQRAARYTQRSLTPPARTLPSTSPAAECPRHRPTRCERDG
jgi:hypothetical protein